jgi:hypothetical protein
MSKVMFNLILTAVKFSVKHLDFISNLLGSADWLYGRESVAMAVEYLFIGGDFLQEMRLGAARVADLPLRARLINRQVTEINRDFGYVHESLLTALQLEQRSGRYRLKSAVLI